MASKQLQAVKSTLRRIWPPHPSSGGRQGLRGWDVGDWRGCRREPGGCPVLLEVFPKPSWTPSSSCLPGILPHPRREGGREGGREACTRLVTEEEAALASRLSPCLSPLLLRLGNWNGNWEREPSHPQCASPCGALSQRLMFPKSYFHVLKSHCSEGAEHSSPLMLWDHGGDEEELQLAQGCSHSNFSCKDNRILAQTV